MKQALLSAVIVAAFLVGPLFAAEASPDKPAAPAATPEAPAAGPEVPAADAPEPAKSAPVVLQLSIKQAIALAMRNNLGLKADRLSVDISAADVVLAGAGLEPYLDASFNFSQVKGKTLVNFGGISMTFGDVGTASETASMSVSLSKRFSLGTQLSLSIQQMRRFGDDLGYRSSSFAPSIGLQLKQPLLKGFGKRYNTAPAYYAGKALGISKENVTSSIHELVTSVENAYWNLFAAREMLTAMEQSLKVARDLEETTKSRLKLGLVAKIELTQARLNVANRRQAVISAQNMVMTAQDALIFAVKPGEENEDWNFEVKLTDKPKVSDFKPNVGTSVKRAILNRPEYRGMVLARQMKEHAVKIALVDTLPALDLTGQVSFSGVDERPDDPAMGIMGPAPTAVESWKSLSEGDNLGWSAGVIFSMSLFRKPELEGLRKAKLELDQVKLQLRSLKSTIVMQVRTAARNVSTAAEQVEVARLAEQLAEERLASARRSLDLGLYTNFDFQQHQEALDLARASRIQTYVNYLLSVSAFQKAEGTIYEKYSAHFGE